MTIIHIASIEDTKYSGVGVVVPEYVIHQQEFEDVAFINVKNKKIDKVKHQIEYSANLKISELPPPYNRPDLVVIHELYYKEFISLYSQLICASVPYIIVPHGGLTKKAQSMKRLKKAVANALIFNRFVKNAVAIQFLTEEEKNDSALNVKSLIVPNGMDIKSRRSEYDEKSISFCYIGRISIFHKGLDLLLESVDRTQDYLRENNVVFNIYGPDCEDAQTLKSQIKSFGIDDLVFIFGGVSGKEKENILLKSTYFIQTSRFEGMPMGLLEALSYGIPCCVTEGTNMASDVNFFSAGYTSDSTIEGICKMLKNGIEKISDRNILSANAVEIIKEKYEWNGLSRRTIEKYKNLLGFKR